MIDEFIMIVESSADARTATKLAERVLVEKVDWLEDEQLKYLFRWSGLEDNTSYSCWKDIKDIMKRAKESGLPIPKYLGHRKTKPLKADGAVSIKILNLVQFLQKTRQIKAIILIRDLDNQPERREGLEQARSEQMNQKSKLAIVIGTANRNREAWVLNGFIALNQQEEQTLAEIKTQLNFDPCIESHRLRATSSGELRNPKEIVEKLTGGNMDREQKCWEETRLEYLRERGIDTGLTDYLNEIEQQLTPIISSE